MSHSANTTACFGAGDWHADIGYPLFCLDPYAQRTFIYDGNPHAAKAFIDFDRRQFAQRINALFHDKSNGLELSDGYAPFCKHLFVPNFVRSLLCQTLEISAENAPLLRSDYAARRKEELPVLTRWFDAAAVSSQTRTASHLDVILYHRAQIEKENAAMGAHNEQRSPWGIISVKPQMVDFEIPMEPSTMMRNALPLKEGGSGVGLDHEKYSESVAFWRRHARIQ